MKKTVGIDLGTTNSAVAHLVDRRPVIVADARGDLLLPSVVGFDVANGLLVGRPARNQLVVAPERTVRSVKRAMGTDQQFEMGGRSWTAPEVSALILRCLIDRVETATGQRPEAAVITVPAWFTEPQRQATREAGLLAGLEVLRLVNEPTAAALTYEGDLDERLLVYDLGGGTFDVSVVERGADFTEVLASRGDTTLGGDDVDLAIARRLADRWGKRGIGQDAIGHARFLAAAERAKIALSTRTTVRVQETFLFGGAHLDMEFTREEMEEVIRPLLEPTIQHVIDALKDARVDVRDVSRMVLVGGMTRMPLVHQLLHDAFGLPVHHEVDPDASVALGAAILAARITGDAVEAMLVDVTPQSLAISVRNRWDEDDPDASVIIERNTVVPVTRSRTFQTPVGGMRKVLIQVGQGESPRFGDLTKLGSFHLEKLSGGPAGEPIDVSMHLDVSGVLKVTAVERKTGREAHVTVTDAPQALAERRRAGGQRAILEVVPAAGLAEAQAAALGLLRQAKSSTGGSADARLALDAAITGLEGACASGEQGAIQRGSDALADAILDLV